MADLSRVGPWGRRSTRHVAMYNRSFAASQTAARRKAGGKSELRRAVRRVTPGQGNLKESGTEKIPPLEGAASAALTEGKGEKVR
jgi:hypothetical protein